MSTLPATVAWERLSPEAAWIMVNIAFPMSCGLSTREVAGHVGETVTWVNGRLDELRVRSRDVLPGA
jgi:hypothetical protein